MRVLIKQCFSIKCLKLSNKIYAPTEGCSLMASPQGTKGQQGQLGETGPVGEPGKMGFVGQKGTRGTIGPAVRHPRTVWD